MALKLKIYQMFICTYLPEKNVIHDNCFFCDTPITVTHTIWCLYQVIGKIEAHITTQKRNAYKAFVETREFQEFS